MILVTFELSSSSEVEAWYALHSWCGTGTKPGEKRGGPVITHGRSAWNLRLWAVSLQMSLRCSWGVPEGGDIKCGRGSRGWGGGGGVVGNREAKPSLVRLDPFC